MVIYFFRIRKYNKKHKIDKLIILTLQTHWLSFLFITKWNSELVLTIHNTNTWFKGNVLRKNILFKIRYLLKRFVRKKYLKKSKTIIVNSINMKEYLLRNKDIKNEYTIFVMPFSLQKSNKEYSSSNKNINIVYPGMYPQIEKNMLIS